LFIKKSFFTCVSVCAHISAALPLKYMHNILIVNALIYRSPLNFKYTKQRPD